MPEKIVLFLFWLFVFLFSFSLAVFFFYDETVGIWMEGVSAIPLVGIIVTIKLFPKSAKI
jgi:hypothetical protein